MAKQPKFKPIDVSADTYYIPEVTRLPEPNGDTESGQSEPTVRKGKQQTVNLSESQHLPDIGEIMMVSLDRIKDSPYQTREDIDEAKFNQIVHSIKTLKQRLVLILCRDPEDQGYFLPMLGGHIRKMAAKEAGLTEIPAIVIEYDQLQLGLGTAQENLGRQDLNLVEKGNLFLLLRKDFKWSQEKLASELGIEGIGRDYIAACELAAQSAKDIQRMLVLKKDGGTRAAGYLRRLDAFFKDTPGKAEKMRSPIIEEFLNEKISTDEVRIRVERIMDSNKQAEAQAEDKGPFVKRFEKVETTKKSFNRFLRLVGEESPTEEERNVLSEMRSDIDTILSRP